MIRFRSFALATFAIWTAAPRAAAQTPTDSTASSVSTDQNGRPSPLCLRGRPAVHCRVFLLTEVAYHLREKEGARAGRGLEPYVSWTYGAMVNLGDSHALGATVMLSALTNGPSSSGRSAWLARYRHWIQDGVALDAALGRSGTHDADPQRRRTTATIGFSLGDYVGVFGHGEDSPAGLQPSGGFKLGSFPGLLLGAATIWLYSIMPYS